MNISNVGHGVKSVVGGGDHNKHTTNFNMACKKSQKAQELDLQVAEAVHGVQSGKYKSSYEAAKALKLCEKTIRRRVLSGSTQVEVRQAQQLLLENQEKTLLKWIKVLTISGYVPTH
jgi:hypothetical protein